MIRSLWTAATGMTAQQLNMDVISNNLANVNTAGFKKSRAGCIFFLFQSAGGEQLRIDFHFHGKTFAALQLFTTEHTESTEENLRKFQNNNQKLFFELSRFCFPL